jgi:hypothetical protein
VIIDVDGSGYHLTSAAGGVLFDFVGGGHLVRIAWTAPGSTNAFLVLPRDGRVDDGSELFGNLAPQPASPRPNGFAALAVWDQPGHGGDGDGIIDPADAIWPRLRLWQDTDHDGKAQPDELRPLSAFGITGISVRYRAAGGADRYGSRYGSPRPSTAAATPPPRLRLLPDHRPRLPARRRLAPGRRGGRRGCGRAGGRSPGAARRRRAHAPAPTGHAAEPDQNIPAPIGR